MSKLKMLYVLGASVFFGVPALATDVSGDVDNQLCKNVIDIIKGDKVDDDSSVVEVEGCGNEIRILQLKQGGVSVVKSSGVGNKVTIVQN